MNNKISFIGSGNMARALIMGLLSNGYAADNILVTNPNSEKLISFVNEFGIRTSTDNIAAVQFADIIVLAVKPQKIKLICLQLAATLTNKKLVISLAAGITIEKMQRSLSANIPIIRAIPNTPAMINSGVTGLFANENTDEHQKNISEAIFRAVGSVFWLPNEADLDAIVAVASSGSAYVFLFMEALQAAAEELQIPASLAKLLVLQTFLGATRLALETKEELAELRRAVTSPQGTTEKAITIFEKENIREIMKKAVFAAWQRAKEIGE